MKITSTLQHEMVAVQSRTELHLLLELTAPTAQKAPDRRPLRLALALDRSGSMDGAPLDAARRAALFLVDNLHDDDQLAVITYDSDVQLLAPMAPLDRRALRQVIDGIEPGGMTNLSGGLLKAWAEASRETDVATLRRAVVLSDGHANQGIRDADKLAEITATQAAAGISTTTIGFGDGFDEDLLTSMADAGRGGAHFAATPEDLPDIFAQEFDDLLALAAQNVTVELRPSDDVAVIEVLNSYPSLLVPGGVQVQVGDAFAGQTMRVVVKLSIPALPGLGLATVGDVVLSWVSIDGDKVEQHTATQALVVNAVSADEAAAASPNATVLSEVTVVLAGRRAAEVRDLADQGRLDDAAELARKTAEELRGISPDHPAAERLKRQAQEMDDAAQRMTNGDYGAMESKQMHYRSRSMSRRKRDS